MLRIYALVAMILAPIFLTTTLVGYSKYKSQAAKVVLLREELSNLKAAQVSKVIEKVEESSKIGDMNLQDQTKIEVHKVETTKVIEKLVQVPVYTNECIDAAGLQRYNETVREFTINNSK